jgi:hypothetical protein
METFLLGEENLFIIDRLEFDKFAIFQPGFYWVCYNRVSRAQRDQMRRAQFIGSILLDRIALLARGNRNPRDTEGY